MGRLLPRKRRWRLLLALVAALAALWFVVPALLVPTIQRKLQAMLAAQLQADVQIGSLRYAPPYGVRARDVSVVADDPKHGKVQVLKVGMLDLKLARLPFGKGPLIIENVTIRQPQVHFVIADGVLVGRGHIVRPQPPPPAALAATPAATMPAPTQPAAPPKADPPAAPDPPPASPKADPPATPDPVVPPQTKLSEMFRLRHFGMYDGTIVIENRDRAGAAPMVWKALDVEMQTEPRSTSAYDFRLGSDPGRTAQLSANGSFDLDELWIQADKLQVTLTADKDDAEKSALPAQIQALLARYEVKGKVTLDLAGRIPIRAPRQASFSGSLEIADASAALPNSKMRVDGLDFRVAFAKDAPPAGTPTNDPRPIRLEIERLAGTSGPARLTTTHGSAAIDDVKGAWSLRDYTADINFGAVPNAPGLANPLAFRFVGNTGRATLRLSCGGKLGVKPADGGIDVDGMTLDVQAEGLTVQPPWFPAPATALRCTGRKTAGTRVLLLTDGTCAYGNDRIMLTSARLRVPADLLSMRHAFRLDEIEGTCEPRPPRPSPYPLGFGRAIENLRPSGVFHIGGGSWYSFDRFADAAPPATSPPATSSSATAPVRRRKIDYFFSIAADDARFDLFAGRVPLTNARGDATFSPEAYRLDGARANVYGGSVMGAFHMTPGQPATFDADISLSKVQLKQIGDAFGLPPAQREKLDGTAYLSIASFGLFPQQGSDEWLKKLRARGEFEVFGGHFWALPVLTDIAGLVGRSDRLTVGEAAGRFDISRGGIDLTRAAVQSPALGLVGSGRIGFDKSLELRVIAAPLGDWRERIKRGGIPIVSDVAGEVFGAMQKVLNTATSRLLYEFHVSGTLKQPKVDTVPVPALTEPAALLLGQMIGDTDSKGHGKWASTAKKNGE